MKSKKNVTQATLEGDVYSNIAEVMTLMGHKMNHCTARNVVLRVMEKILTEFINNGFYKNLPPEQIKEIAASPDFQEAIIMIAERVEDARKKEVSTQ